jgi:hypothetical protein
MMARRILFLTSLAAFLASAQTPAKFVGVWKLISFEQRTTAGGVTYPMGQRPVGRITYDASGHMTAQLMLPDRPKFEAPSKVRGSIDQKIAAFDGYVAYYGTYTVDEAHRTVVHHVEASLYPNWVGTEQRRLFEFAEGKLILRAVNGSGGPGTESRLVWERVK